MKYRMNSYLKLAPNANQDYESTCQRYGTRVQLGSYVADIVPDDDENPLVHHCIVQRVGSPNILYLGQEGTFTAALESGYRHLEELAGPRPKKTTAIYEFKAPELK
jgi:hypothetical protein